MRAVYEFLFTTLGWPLASATAFFAMTMTALGLLATARKDDIALWLMGGDTTENWSKTFLSLFDALFGEHHFSLKCAARSAIASLIAVSSIWGLMIWSGHFRIDLTDTTLTKAITIGVAVNLAADYISLLETRWLLGRIARIRSKLLHALILLADLAITAAIILITIWAFRSTGLLPNDDTDWLAITLAFSIYSAPFYSTFLTSIWTWAYILSTWVMRFAKNVRLSHWLAVETKPTLILSLILSVFVYAAASAVSLTMEKGKDDLSPLDMAVCQTFKGDICLRMIGIADTEETRFLLQLNACEGGLTAGCMEEIEAIDDRTLRLLSAACKGGNQEACLLMGLVF